MKIFIKKINIALLIIPSIFFASVEHKDEFIDTYLNNISGNLDEKTEIITHICQNPNGTYIDIGTGGDAVYNIIKKIPKNFETCLIASDIDPVVLESIKKRRPEILKYLNATSGPKIELVPMSAVNMVSIKNNSISGIGASALVHEIFSYITPKSSLDQLLDETCRVLEKNGIFVYRDPKWVNNPQESCILVIKNNLTKYYISLFLSKFLDRKFSMIKDYKGDCYKPDRYTDELIQINVYIKGHAEMKKLSFNEFINTPSSLIDYIKNFSIEAPLGLIAEMQRHYLMFLKNYFAPGLIDERFFKNDLDINTLSKEEKDILINFARRKSLTINDNLIKKEDFPLYFKDANKLTELFEKEMKISPNENIDFVSFIKNISFEGINRNLFFLEDSKTLVIDPKMLALLFHGKDEGIFKYLQNEKDFPWDILEHLKLEGEEHYFYKTTDELITYMGQYSKFILKNSCKKNIF